ncbi:MAG: nitrogenase component 1, partial [Clostridiales bacterium]
SQQMYSGGYQNDKLSEYIENIIKLGGVSCIVLYTSCMERILNWDLNSLCRGLENPENIPIKILFRGPLVQENYKNTYKTEKLFCDILINKNKINPNHNLLQLPPLATDFSGVSSFLQECNSTNYLLTPGGCGGCIKCCDGIGDNYRLKNTRINNALFALGCKNAILKAIKNDLPKNSKAFCALMSTPSLWVSGVDIERICQDLCSHDIAAINLDSNGFDSGVTGIDKGMFILEKKLFSKYTENKTKKVCIVGYSNLAMGLYQKIEHGAEHLERIGYQTEKWNFSDSNQCELPTLNWVVSSEGLKTAQWQETMFNVPYISGIPVGAHGMLKWRKEINQKLNRDSEETISIPDAAKKRPWQPNILIIGEPLLNNGIKYFLCHEQGFHHILTSVYTANTKHRNVYTTENDDSIYFSSKNELIDKLLNIDIIIGDPIYKIVLQNNYKNAKFIEIPYPMLSGKTFLNQDYCYFGKKGATYIMKNIDSIINCNI